MRNLLSAMLVTAFLASGIAVPAQAAAADIAANCPSEYFCVYRYSFYSGEFWRWKGNDGDYRNNYSNGISADNRGTSFINNGVPGEYDVVLVFAGYNYGNDLILCLGPGQDVYNADDYADNRASSHIWARYCP